MGRWAKNHDQRKGQWLINAIRSDPTFPRLTKQQSKNMSLDDVIPFEKKAIEIRLWNMTNEEFEKIMEKYYE